MKRAEIKTTVDRYLEGIGFSRGSWLWQPGGSLVAVIDGRIMSMKLRAGMTKSDLKFHLGIMSGWAQMAGIEPGKKAPTRTANGHAHRHIGLTEFPAIQAG